MWESTHLAQESAKPVVDDEKLTLYNMRFCPFAERTALVLLAKNLEFENINIDLKKKPDWFVESTFGKVPVLLYKGKIIPESLITSDYLDEVRFIISVDQFLREQKYLQVIIHDAMLNYSKFHSSGFPRASVTSSGSHAEST